MKKLTIMMGLTLVAVLMIACAGPGPEPAAPVVEEAPAVEEVAEEVVEDAPEEAEEEMAEEEMAEEMTEAAEEEAEEVAEEEMDEEEMDEDAEVAEEAAEVTYVVDADASTVGWTGAKAVGNSHDGTVDISEGALVVENGALLAGSFVLDMATISSNPARLVNHLKDDDFFGVDTYPTASLVIVSVEALGDDQYAVTADLTIKEITNPIEFTATAMEDGATLTATAEMIFDRTLYDVQYGSAVFFNDLGDDLINDEVEMRVSLVANSE